MRLLKVDQAITPQACETLVNIYESLSDIKEKDPFGSPTVRPGRDCQLPNRNFVASIVRTCRSIIAKETGLPLAALKVETVLMARLGNGGHHPKHADNAKLVDGQWVPNHAPRRTTSALLYLNEGFTGGEIVFEERGVQIAPRTGMLVAFPSTFEFPHEVKEVTSGKRYSLAMWFSTNPEHVEAWV